MLLMPAEEQALSGLCASGDLGDGRHCTLNDREPVVTTGAGCGFSAGTPAVSVGAVCGFSAGASAIFSGRAGSFALSGSLQPARDRRNDVGIRLLFRGIWGPDFLESS